MFHLAYHTNRLDESQYDINLEAIKHGQTRTLDTTLTTSKNLKNELITCNHMCWYRVYVEH